MLLYTIEITSTHPKAVLTNENTKYVKNANIHPCLIVSGTHDTRTRQHQPVLRFVHTELFLFLCVNKELRVLTVTKDALRGEFF